jgi:hypothetical protein
LAKRLLESYLNFFNQINNMRKITMALLSFAAMTFAHAQKNGWSPNNVDARNIAADKGTARLSFPTNFKLINLNLPAFRQAIFPVVGNATRHATIVAIPNAAGQLEDFEIVEASNFEPALQARFPEIRAFSGKGITDKTALLKLSYSPQGIQTMVFRTDKPAEFMEPYSQDHRVYAVYAAQGNKGNFAWTCATPDEALAHNLDNQVHNNSATARSGGDLKVMRLAQSVTAEYSNYFGASNASQVNLVLAAVNTTLTRCNGVYEKDLALHLNLVSASTNVFYYDPSTDPYSAAAAGSGGAWNNELQNTLTAVIGEANYDVGHLFGASGGGGNAGCIGCVCVNGSKGKGFTSPADGIPQGDKFDIDYVVHEIGHQLGGNHTFSQSNEGTGVNKEPGSGITIMGYAGITGFDLAPNSIAFYHQASIAQIQANLATKTCPVTTTLSNATPVVNTLTNYTIPISTPFALTGSATDANAGDVLTYSWEQNDNAGSSQTGASSVASATKATGPNWISFAPTTSPTRYFPKLSTILAGGTLSGPLTGGDAGANTEALSSVARTLNFRLTVRDNAPYSSTAPVSVGQTQFRDMVVTVSSGSGPFAVTAPNTAVTWAGGSAQTITWSVNNTTAAPVSCANVKISLSTDGGLSFPTVLVASTPNDGSEVLTIPATPSTSARIKVEAVNNIFFDISNANFTIGAAATCGNATGLASSSITNNSATVSWTAVSGASSYAVDYKANSAATWISLSTAQTGTSANISGLAQGTLYDWRVRATCAGGTGNFVAAQFTTTAPATCNAPGGLTSASITASSATVSWTAVSGASSYAVDYKTTSATAWTSLSTAQTGTSASITGLSASTVYDWRVRTNCSGSSSSFSQAQFTTTAAGSTCPGSFDVSTNGTVSGAATIPFNTAVKGTISASGDNDYYKFVITTGGTATITLTTLPFDYDVRLYSSNGTTQLAISQAGGTSNETISRTYTAGTYYVYVYGYNGANSATNCYTLKVQLGTASRPGDNTDVFVKAADDKLSVMPNPANSIANVYFNAAKAGSANISIVNQLGALVLTRKMTVSEGSNQASIDVSGLASGLYYLKLQNGETVQMTKLMVSK